MDFIAEAALRIFPFLAVITIVVFFHELGHFLVARWNGIRVEVFSIGFGGEIFGWRDKYGTRWRISWVPLGGYVKFFGDAGATSAEGDGLDEMTAAERAVSFHHKRLWQRASVVVAGPVANFILAIIVFAVMFATVGQRISDPIVVEGPAAPRRQPDSNKAIWSPQLTVAGYPVSRSCRHTYSPGPDRTSRSALFETVKR